MFKNNLLNFLEFHVKKINTTKGARPFLFGTLVTLCVFVPIADRAKKHRDQLIQTIGSLRDSLYLTQLSLFNKKVMLQHRQDSIEDLRTSADRLRVELNRSRQKVELLMTRQRQPNTRNTNVTANSFATHTSSANFNGKVMSVSSRYARSASSREIDIAYIRRFAHIAQREHSQFHIPASITLAQALWESNAGTSNLAKKANQHFGIKWTNRVGGPIKDHVTGKYAAKDDDRRNGRLIHSQFVKFDRPWASYRFHSLFLQLPNYRPCYRCGNNYQCWAKTIKKRGYATDPRYAEKLIATIEQYRLYQFDY